ncbi:MAG: helix-turn-helix domain-containing protein [Alphaproteobacteria bacterium]|nr:helix-turn-helix domain-containing protein [Alphaproteobacteria bacterium]
MADSSHHYMNTREVADLLGLSPRTLDRYRVSGDGPAFHKFGNRVRYLRADVEAWASKRRRQSTSDDGFSQDAP